MSQSRVEDIKQRVLRIAKDGRGTKYVEVGVRQPVNTTPDSRPRAEVTVWDLSKRQTTSVKI